MAGKFAFEEQTVVLMLWDNLWLVHYVPLLFCCSGWVICGIIEDFFHRVTTVY